MDLLQKNPFTTIKANDLNDSEINEQWVDIQDNGFLDLFSPKEPMAQYILGGKGSGKTHLMRYFSYKSQLLRNKRDPINLLVKDGYFGVYFQASGLNGSRFEHLPLEPAARNAIFEYSFELWFAGIVLEALLELKALNHDLIRDEEAFCKDISNLINKEIEDIANTNNIRCLRDELVKLSNKVDLEVNNSFFKQTIDIEILTNRGALIFGIPKLLSKHSDTFKNISFLYLIDELENISKDQQIYINTLVREKKLPVSFRLGARMHGIKSWETLGAGEANRKDNEHGVIRLDDAFDKKDYETFATNLIINRLISVGFVNKDFFPNDNSEDTNKLKISYLSKLFEEPNLEQILGNSKKRSSDEFSQIIKSFNSRFKISKLDSLELLENLSCPEDLRVEKAAIHLFCQSWKNNSSASINELVKYSEDIKINIQSFIENRNDINNPISQKLKYFSNNYTASVLRANSPNNLELYAGFQQLLTVTKGFPRHILTVLRHAYKIELFNGSTPFLNGNKLSLKSQTFALKESADWFHEDCISEGKLGTNVGIALDRLCEILRLEMYADKPVECSASSFTVDFSSLSNYSKSVLEWAEMIRVIIPADTKRQEKNSQKLVNKYHLNGLLCPKWGLSLARRGAISFKVEDFEKILTPELVAEFNEFKQLFEQMRYAPFNTNEPKTKPKPKPKQMDSDEDKQLGWKM